ncbi:hypothetical protein ABZ682_22800 [Streptomyces griseoviridis]|uniref:hypothetical protein n=1 Tax=Streptomyces griseoviridis TaxID=45398 RepID=UPI0033F97BAD
MGFKDFARSLKPGDDVELASTRYAGQQSASVTAAVRRQQQEARRRAREAAESAKRRQRHRAAVARDGDNQRGRVPKSWTRDRE